MGDSCVYQVTTLEDTFASHAETAASVIFDEFGVSAVEGGMVQDSRRSD